MTYANRNIFSLQFFSYPWLGLFNIAVKTTWRLTVQFFFFLKLSVCYLCSFGVSLPPRIHTYSWRAAIFKN